MGSVTFNERGVNGHWGHTEGIECPHGLGEAAGFLAIVLFVKSVHDGIVVGGVLKSNNQLFLRLLDSPYLRILQYCRVASSRNLKCPNFLN